MKMVKRIKGYQIKETNEKERKEGLNSFIIFKGGEEEMDCGSMKEVYEFLEVEQPKIEEAKVEEMKLTTFEKELLNGMITNDYSNQYHSFMDLREMSGEWLFAIVDECSFNEKQSRGVVSSLVKKGLIQSRKEDEGYVIGLMKRGFDLLDKNNGELLK